MKAGLVVETIDIRLGQTELLLEWLVTHHGETDCIRTALDAVHTAHDLIEAMPREY